ncbi:hypothetical protein T01_14581 [Trichinella spiralis]|uniref:Uncharacterized protein n=1 Tax=Trichinella spiralis TaxID=6334 RepID=A0A0V1BUI1_TRISP|nr:hypothetical protein T01_14581 [Trichinella spiralis]
MPKSFFRSYSQDKLTTGLTKPSQGREASREPEGFRHVLPDEGDCGPGVQQAIHHHVVSVWPISASRGSLETFPGGALHGQNTLVGSV